MALLGPRRGRYTLAAEQFARLGPGESVTKHLTLVPEGIPPGRYDVKLAYTPRAAGSGFSFPERWGKEHGFDAKPWIGMALSEPMTVEVVSP